MKKRIVVPIAEENGLKSSLSGHFGSTPYFAVVDLDAGNVLNVKTFPNAGEHHGGRGLTHNNVLELHPDVIVAYGMGPGGLNAFQSTGVAVLKAVGKNVSEVIEAYQRNELEVLTEGCHEARHCHH